MSQFIRNADRLVASVSQMRQRQSTTPIPMNILPFSPVIQPKVATNIFLGIFDDLKYSFDMTGKV
jgi:hypothetical protein